MVAGYGGAAIYISPLGGWLIAHHGLSGSFIGLGILFALVVTSLAKQVWRVPNELQPALIDPGAYAATPADVKLLLQTQQVAVNIVP